MVREVTLSVAQMVPRAKDQDRLGFASMNSHTDIVRESPCLQAKPPGQNPVPFLFYGAWEFANWDQGLERAELGPFHRLQQ
jgi:hypothetical protein